MEAVTFEGRLRAGKANNHIYSRNGMDGLVSVWMHDSKFILTWEECPKGCQFDESTYTRDDRVVFNSFPELMAFLLDQKLSHDLFKP